MPRIRTFAGLVKDDLDRAIPKMREFAGAAREIRDVLKDAASIAPSGGGGGGGIAAGAGSGDSGGGIVGLPGAGGGGGGISAGIGSGDSAGGLVGVLTELSGVLKTAGLREGGSEGPSGLKAPDLGPTISRGNESVVASVQRVEAAVNSLTSKISFSDLGVGTRAGGGL